MEDLMLFFLLDLCSESWLLLAAPQSADRLEAESEGVSGGGAYVVVKVTLLLLLWMIMNKDKHQSSFSAVT